MKKRAKGIITFILIFGLLLAIFHLFLTLYLGDIDYKMTWDTNYKSINQEEQIIETFWGDLKTPTGWKNISYKPTCPGYVGSFWTGKEFIEYEYGFFAPGLEDMLSGNQKIEMDTINNFIIHKVSDQGITGLHIPRQNNMVYGLTIYSSITEDKLTERLKVILTNIEYKN